MNCTICLQMKDISPAMKSSSNRHPSMQFGPKLKGNCGISDCAISHCHSLSRLTNIARVCLNSKVMQFALSWINAQLAVEQNSRKCLQKKKALTQKTFSCHSSASASILHLVAQCPKTKPDNKTSNASMVRHAG